METEGIRIASTTETEAEMRTALGIASPPEPAAPVVEAPAAPVDVAPAAEPIAAPAASASKKQTARERIAEITREKHALIAKATAESTERAAREAENADLRRQLAALQPAKAPEAMAPAADPEPQQDQFPSYEAFIVARTRWQLGKDGQLVTPQLVQHLVQQQMQQAAQQQQWQAEQQRQADRVTRYNDRLARVREQRPDFDAVLASSAHIVPPAPVVDAIRNSPVGPDLVYYLSAHPQEIDRLAQLPTVGDVIYEVGTLAARYMAGQLPIAPLTDEAGAPVPTREVARPVAESQAMPMRERIAPPVVAAVGPGPMPMPRVGAGRAVATPTLDELPYNQYKQEMDRRDREKRGGRRLH